MTFSKRNHEYLVAFAETPTDGFTSVDAHFGWRPLPAHTDLTDSVQRNTVLLNKDDVILPGRDIRAVVHATF
jgi:iron complex outermembrane receptor protein